MKKPIKTTNREFLQGLAGEHWERVPVSWGSRSWVVYPAGDVIDARVQEDSNYFTVSFFALAMGGDFRRKKELFERQFVFVIDDVRQKLDEAEVRKLMPPSTYELETSPGNFQFGYKLTNGTDARKLEALIEAIVGNPAVNPSLRDPGMKGVTRPVRLPVGSNNKDTIKAKNGGEGWRHRLWRWEPSIAYSVEELAEWLDVDLSAKALEKFKDIGGSRKATAAELEADPILKLFDMRGMLRDATPNDNGFVTVRCPWADEHSDARDEAGYRPGLGGFQCHHGHCEGRGMHELKAWAEEVVTPEERAKALGETFGDLPDDDPALRAAVEAAKKVDRERTEKMRRKVKEVESEWAFIVGMHRFGRVSTNEILHEKTFNAESKIENYGKTGERSAAAIFLNEMDGPRCKSATYYPGRPAIYTDPNDGRNVFNTWRGGPIERDPFDVDDEEISVWLDHVEHILPDPVARRLFFDFWAFIFQNPGGKILWCYTIIGGYGVGKDLMVKPMRLILGDKNFRSIGVHHIEKWTWWAEAQAILLEELPPFHKRDVYERMKPYIAGQGTIVVDIKGIPHYEIQNFTNWMAFSNHDNALALPEGDRRFYVYATPAEKRSAAYYKLIADAFENPTILEKIYGWLLDRDIRHFNPGERPPMTEAKAKMIAEARDPGERYVRSLFDEDGHFEGRELIAVKEILSDAKFRASTGGDIEKKTAESLTSEKISAVLRRMGAKKLKRKLRGSSDEDQCLRLWALKRSEFYSKLSETDIDELRTRYDHDRRGRGAERESEAEIFEFTKKEKERA